jgi:hypothetical protein
MSKIKAPRPKKTRTRNLDHHAFDIARDNHEKNFSSRRGFGGWQGRGTSVGFFHWDNNPWGNDDELRGGHYAGMTAMLAARGCRIAAHASYPVTGEERGYTIAAIYLSAAPESVEADCAAARAYIEARVADAYASSPQRNPDDGVRERDLHAEDDECVEHSLGTIRSAPPAINAPGGDA